MTVEPESVHALTGAYVLDALDADELNAFERHLAVCADCREEVRSLRAAVVRLPSVSAVAPPPELRASVLAAITTVRPLPPLPEQDEPVTPAAATETTGAGADAREDLLAPAPIRVARERRNRRAERWRLVAAAAVVVALVSVGWGIARPDDREPGRGLAGLEQPSDDRMAQLLAAPDLQVFVSASGDEVHGTVLRSVSLDLAAMLLQDLPDVPAGHTFQAWTISDAAPVGAGVFAAPDGTASMMLDGDAADADAVAITIEPEGGSTAPTGEVLVQVPVT